MEASFVGIFQSIFLPLLTLVGGWFAHLVRTKQKKESDILDNVKQILEMQKEYISEQQGVIVETKNVNKRLEAKLDKKNKSIRQANKCRYTNEGDGCPVLNMEEKFDDCVCDGCEFSDKKE